MSAANNQAQQPNINAEDQGLEHELEEIYENESNEIFAFKLTQDFVDLALHSIEDTYFEQKSVPHAVENMIDKMTAILDFVFLKKDYLPKTAADDDNWQKDEPIECPKADSWSGIVPIMAKVPLDELIKKKELEEQQMMLAKKRKKINSSQSKKSASIANQKNDPKLLSATGNSENISAQTEGMSGRLTNSKSNLSSRKKLKIDKTGPSEEQTKQDNSKLVQGLIEEREKEFERVKQTMRGKQYVYNREGEPIEIKKVAANALPEQTVIIDAVVKDKKKGMGASGNAPNGAKGGNNALNNLKPASKKLPVIEETKAVFSMISGIKPSPGVTIRDGSRVLKGTLIPRDTLKEETV